MSCDPLQCHVTSHVTSTSPPTDSLYLGPSCHVTLSPSSHVISHVTSTPPPADSLLSSLYSGPLLAIMSGLVESVLRAPAGLQQLRAYLYGSLLFYLSMTQRSKGEEPQLAKGQGSGGMRAA